ncbi:MAG: hypothetical protein J3R72DRAFT_72711 [Linnemannia gamsii]|nr:MAG: hypothetical protein J3R72DRAFT_72711 [Linnemannia gamsii]
MCILFFDNFSSLLVCSLTLFFFAPPLARSLSLSHFLLIDYTRLRILFNRFYFTSFTLTHSRSLHFFFSLFLFPFLIFSSSLAPPLHPFPFLPFPSLPFASLPFPPFFSTPSLPCVPVIPSVFIHFIPSFPRPQPFSSHISSPLLFILLLLQCHLVYIPLCCSPSPHHNLLSALASVKKSHHLFFTPHSPPILYPLPFFLHTPLHSTPPLLVYINNKQQTTTNDHTFHSIK